MSKAALLFFLAATCAFGAEALVRLRVLDGDTGHWLGGAKVKAGASTFTTAADGECAVPAATGTQLVVAVSADGFYTATDTVAVSATDLRHVVRVYGTRPRTVIGFVKDGSSGRRLARAQVRVIGGSATTAADSTGMYAIPFPPGNGELIASRPGFRGFPRRLTVRAGDTLSVDLPLFDTATAVGEVAGRVEVQGFGAAIGASVTVEGTRLGTASNRDGDFIITGVPAGQHRLIFTYAGCKKTMRVVNVPAWKSLALNVQLERRPPTSGY